MTSYERQLSNHSTLQLFKKLATNESHLKQIVIKLISAQKRQDLKIIMTSENTKKHVTFTNSTKPTGRFARF